MRRSSSSSSSSSSSLPSFLVLHKRSPPLLLLLLFLLLPSSLSVDRNNFKTCDQSGFCKLQRAVVEGSSKHEVLAGSWKEQDHRLSADLVVEGKQDERLRLEIWRLEDNSVRVVLNEVDGAHPRFEVKDSLATPPRPLPFKRTTGADGVVSLDLGEKTKVIVYPKPFRIDLIGESGEALISINAKGKLLWEHYKKKHEEAKPAEVKKENEDGNADDSHHHDEEAGAHDEKGITESWKSHVDSRPRGPSSVGIDVSFQGFQHVYGIPEHADSFSLRSTTSTDPYRLYNLDVFEYELNNPMALYGSVPYMLAHNEADGTVGIFLNNAAEMWVDISNTVTDKGVMSKIYDIMTSSSSEKQRPDVDTHWMAEAGLLDLFIFMGPTAKDVFRQYGRVTGTTPLPPSFALAYHQCRWNYNDEEDILGVDNNFDKFDIPVDVIWLDIEHTRGKRYFTWDAQKFPDSARMIDKVASKGRKMVTIVDPHIKRDTDYHVYREAKDNKFLISHKNGNEYDGWCWPGSSSYPDFTDERVRNWWADQFALDKYKGSTKNLFTWNDMNEPSVFNGPEVTMEKDALHIGGVEHREVHNLYGMYVAMSTSEGLIRRSGRQERPFVLSRAFFAGSQRAGAIWTGDNTAEWSHLEMSIPMLLSVGVAGVTFVGADVGGFFKNPDAELQTRWYQAAAYQPFFRSHAHIDTKRREPWLLPNKNLQIVRQALRNRYALLPYWYTLFREAAVNGTPPMRPLWAEFPKDPNGFATQDEYMVGAALLVHPVTQQGATSVVVYFPGGATDVWYDAKTGALSAHGGVKSTLSVGLETVPVFQRGGTIVPYRNRIRRASSLMEHDPFSLVVALDPSTGEASGSLYLDDGRTFSYRDGHFLHRSFKLKNGVFEAKSADHMGAFVTNAWIEKITIFGYPSAPKSVILRSSGSTTPLQSDFDPHTRVLIIRKPGVNVAMDFTVTLA